MKLSNAITCVFALIFSGTVANADDLPLTKDGRFPIGDELCGLVVDTSARLIMLKRQNDEPILETMKTVLDDLAIGLSDTLREMVIAAYDSPSWPTRDSKLAAVDDFANDWVVACYKAQ